MLRWFRRWRERDDQRLVKRTEPFPDVNPIEVLIRIVKDAQERDAEDERRLYSPGGNARQSSYPRRQPGGR
jgi:hypothetical protein